MPAWTYKNSPKGLVGARAKSYLRRRLEQRVFLNDSLAAFTSQRHIFCRIFESIAKRRWDALMLLSETRIASFHLGARNNGVELLERVIWIYNEVHASH
jgi:hypothetical protein